MCYCEPSAEYSSGYNKDCGYTKGSTKCFEREAIPNMFLGSLEGYKICATRGAKPFKIAQRPVDIGGGILGCPTDTFACDEDVFTNKTVTVDQVLADPEHKANFMVCAGRLDQCPITTMDIVFNQDLGRFSITTTKRAVNLPLMSFKLSQEQPCLSPTHWSGDQSNLFVDEVRKTVSPCPENEYFEDVKLDPRYQLIPGGYEINSGRFELENGQTYLWEERYSVDEPAESLIKQLRQRKSLYPFARPTLGWAMECELDDSIMDRQEVYDQILNYQFKSQEPEIGVKEKAYVTAVMILSFLCFVIVVFVTMISGFKNGPDEDDGFWEVYDSHWRTAIFMSVILTAIGVLSVPISYEYTMVMLETMEDEKFTKTDLPKLEGCIDDYNIKEILAVSKDKTFEQLIMHYIQVGLSGGTIFFALCNVFGALIRRCCERLAINR